MSLTYSEAKQRLIGGLLRAAESHEAGHFAGIEVSFDQLDAELPRDAGPAFDNLLLAFDFWDYWIDARNHDWQYYKGVPAEDWPRMARSIVADLEADHEITDELVLSRFDFRNTTREPGLLRRLARVFLRKG